MHVIDSALLGLPDKGRALKGLVVCTNWDLEPLDLINGLALGCYQPSPMRYNYVLIYVDYRLHIFYRHTGFKFEDRE